MAGKPKAKKDRVRRTIEYSLETQDKLTAIRAAAAIATDSAAIAKAVVFQAALIDHNLGEIRTALALLKKIKQITDEGNIFIIKDPKRPRLQRRLEYLIADTTSP